MSCAQINTTFHHISKNFLKYFCVVARGRVWSRTAANSSARLSVIARNHVWPHAAVHGRTSVCTNNEYANNNYIQLRAAAREMINYLKLDEEKLRMIARDRARLRTMKPIFVRCMTIRRAT